MILPPHFLFFLPQMYYFVETLPVSAIVSSRHQNWPTQPIHAGLSKLIRRSTDPSLLLIPTLIAFSGSGSVFSILLHDLTWAAANIHVLFLSFAGYLSICDTQPAPVN